MFLKKKSFALKGAFFIAASMIFAACGSDNTKEESITAPVEDSVVAEAETQEITYSLPSPLQIAVGV